VRGPTHTLMNRLLAPLWLGFALAFTLPAPAVPPAEKLLPADTLVLLNIPDWDKTAAAAKDFSFVQLWRDPAMRPFATKFEEKFREFIGQEGKNFERDWEEFKPLMSGQITLGVVPNELAGEPNTGPEMVILMDVKDKAKQLTAFLERCEKRDANAGMSMQRETVRGVKFTRAVKAKDDDAGKKKSQPFVGQAGSLLLLSENTKVLEKVLARKDGGGTGLDENPEFERARSTVGRDAQAFGWVNMKAFVAMLAKLPSPLEDITPQRILDAIGLGGVDGLAMAARQANEGMHVDVFVQAPEARRKGLMNILAIEPKEAGPVPIVGADVAKFTRIRLDGAKAFATVERILTDLNPQMAGVVTLLLENVGKDKDPNFDLRKQLFGNLGTDFITVQKSPSGTTLAEMKSPPSLFLIGSPKPEALLQALRTVSPLPPQEREFLGRKIYTLSLLPGMGAPAGGNAQLVISTTGGYLAVATDVAMLEKLLRGAEGQAKPLSGVAGLAEAAEKVGGFQTGWFQYDNQVETVRLLMEMLKRDPTALEQMFALPVPAPGAGLAPLKELQNIMDFSLLPPFGAIAKYLGFTVTATATTPEGISFKSFLPTPAGLKK